MTYTEIYLMAWAIIATVLAVNFHGKAKLRKELVIGASAFVAQLFKDDAFYAKRKEEYHKLKAKHEQQGKA